MDTLDSDFEFVAASVERAARIQRAACRDVLDDPSAKGHALAGHLDLAYDAVERRVANRRTMYAVAPDDTVRSDAIVEMRRLVWDVRRLQTNLAWLEAAQEPPLDLGTTYFVESAARALVARDVEVTVVATDFTSYATSSDPWEPLIADWGIGVPPGAPTVVVVFIPRRERHSGLLHPLIIHELGHAADTEHGLVDEIWDVAQQRKRLAARFAKAVSEFATAEKLDVGDARNILAAQLRSWIAEALCDSIAVHHLGPTYLYSFLAEVAAGSLDEPGPKHPPARQRVRLLMTHLSRLNWTDRIAARDPALAAWIDEHTAEDVPYSGAAGFLVWAVDELSAVIRTRTTRLLGKRVFLPDADELAEVDELLRASIPPAQRQSGVGVRRESIIVACWESALAAAGGGPAALADAPDAPALAAILPAALEMSALTAAWGK